MLIHVVNVRPIYQVCHDVNNFIRSSENNLRIIGKEVYSRHELNDEKKLALNDIIFAEINKIEDQLKQSNLDNDAIKKLQKLQKLKIEYGMAAIKCGDTDWESFGLSTEVYQNNEQFFQTGDCLLSEQEQQRVRISKKDRDYSYYCCLHNLAHNITYDGIAAPNNQQDVLFVQYNDLIKHNNLPDDVASAIINVKIIQQLYRDCTNKINHNIILDNPVLVILNRINAFYDNYLAYLNTELIPELKDEAIYLSYGLKVFIPEPIKVQLGIC